MIFDKDDDKVRCARLLSKGNACGVSFYIFLETRYLCYNSKYLIDFFKMFFKLLIVQILKSNQGEI